MKTTLYFLPILLAVISFAGCNGRDQYLTPSEVWGNADSLAGERIRVRALGVLRYEPFHPLQVGGCAPESFENPAITGRVILFEGSRDNPIHPIVISESSLQCEGNTCSVTCSPFNPPPNLHGFVNAVPDTYEFVGTLIVDSGGGNRVLILDEIDVEASRQLKDGVWEPLPAGEFTSIFP
ncbi:MAG: hypothetical protein QNJ45_01140 [Ardenticatenaceae bacterium]|nr:hypothetical protein [Ardenticatenaceae bacterium]